MSGLNPTTEYIRNTLRKSSGMLKELEEYAVKNRVPIVTPEVAQLLVVMGHLVKPDRILEVGTAIGYSAILLAGTLAEGGRIDTIERQEEMIFTARSNIKKAGLENVVGIIAGDASDVLPCLDKKYDLIFLDAAKGQYPEFLPQCLRLLRNGGLLVSDNILYKGMIADDELVVRRKRTIVNRMRSYLEILCDDISLDTSILSVGDGVALSYKRMESDK